MVPRSATRTQNEWTAGAGYQDVGDDGGVVGIFHFLGIKSTVAIAALSLEHL